MLTGPDRDVLAYQSATFCLPDIFFPFFFSSFSKGRERLRTTQQRGLGGVPYACGIFNPQFWAIAAGRIL